MTTPNQHAIRATLMAIQGQMQALAQQFDALARLVVEPEPQEPEPRKTPRTFGGSPKTEDPR